MLATEATWIGNFLASLPVAEISPCLNLGSSTGDFRTRLQPYIQNALIAPNERRGVKFIHADMKQETGVDLAGDIFNPRFRTTLAKLRPASVLCCNMFEHVTDRALLANACRTVVRAGGYLIISVPYSYPYHADPIDTYYRPTPTELASLFPECEVVSAIVVVNSTYFTELTQKGVREGSLILAKTLFHLPIPFYRWEIWKSKAHKILWLFRHYRVSIVVLRC